MGQVEVGPGKDDGVAQHRFPAHSVQLTRACIAKLVGTVGTGTLLKRYRIPIDAYLLL